MRLKNRQSQIPNGYKFRQPQINWDSVKVIGLHPSFSTLVTAVMSARAANPHHAAKFKWATDRAGVEHDVEQYNVKLCQANGWTQYLADSGGGGGPFPSSQSLPDQKQLGVAVAAVRKLWAGIKTLNEFLDSGEPPVEPELAEKRAAVCVACSKNTPGNFSAWFTAPASAVVTKQLERLQQRQISTSQDSKLNICDVCWCPMKLKVQTPLKFIRPHVSDEMVQDLKAANPECWIPKELS